MFDTIKSIIGDIATGAIKDQRIALSAEQLAALDRTLQETLAENATCNERVAELERLVTDQQAQLDVRAQAREYTDSEDVTVG